FQPDELTLEVVEDGTTQGTTTIVASDLSTATVDLVAIDNDTLAAPTWLDVPATWTTGVPLALDVDASGLELGAHSATITAFAAGYEDGTLELSLTVTPSATNDTVLVDFGSPTLQTTGAPRYWNNVHTSNMTTPLALNTVAGVPSGITLTVNSSLRFNGANTNGTTVATPGSDLAALQYPATAMQDSLFGNDVEFSGGTYPVARIVLSGLDPTARYDLIFVASRMSVTDVRTADHLVIGDSVAMDTLDASNNQSNVAGVLDMGPNASNEIMITIDKGATNTNSYGFYYLGTLEIRKNGG
ncbi:MAG: hypothetical protein JXO22_03025, partial [Phycisphaerae bacterium]|nr:hypothetical protein [Phycisphaerae bacterium]